MPRFFTEDVEETRAVIRGEDARHLLRVLRVKQGEQLTVCDLKGFDYLCEVQEPRTDEVWLTVLERRPNETEPKVKITLYQALPKADKLEFIIQKAVEMGVFKIVPVQTKYCVAKLNESGFLKKKERYEKIAFEAAKQCGRGIIPEIGNILCFGQAVSQMKQEPSLVFYEGGGERVCGLVSDGVQQVSLLIGSEGGFSEEEMMACEEAGVRRATLGKRILRCETAPIAALSLVLNAVGEI